MQVSNKAQNISEEEATRRLRGGIFMLMIALGGAVVLKMVDASPAFRMALFVPFFMAEYSFFQAVYKTCGVAALRGTRSMGEGTERIADPRERQACLCAGRTQIFHALSAALVLTAVFVWLSY